jgi:hypothetical protein
MMLRKVSLKGRVALPVAVLPSTSRGVRRVGLLELMPSPFSQNIFLVPRAFTRLFDSRDRHRRILRTSLACLQRTKDIASFAVSELLCNLR